MAGTKFATFANLSGGALPSGSGKTFDTLAGQRGAATFVSSNSVAVTLPVALPDTAYRVGVSANANETIWVENKTTTGFDASIFEGRFHGDRGLGPHALS